MIGLTDIQILILVIIVFGLLFLFLFWDYTKKKMIFNSRIDLIEKKIESKPTFSEQILIAYWNEIKNIDIDSQYLITFVDFLREKLAIVKDMAELIVANFEKTNKRDFGKVFDIKRQLLKSKLQNSNVPDAIKSQLSPVSQKQVESVKFKLGEITELNIDIETKRDEVKKCLLEFVTDNFRQSVLYHNLAVGSENETYNFPSSDFDDEISRGNLLDAALILHRKNKNKNQVLQIIQQINDLEIREIEGTLSTEDMKIIKSRITTSLQKLNEVINRK